MVDIGMVGGGRDCERYVGNEQVMVGDKVGLL
jgi:hypothetical protein